jgi:hypothetical protein
MVFTRNGCKRWYKVDINAFATNLVEIEKKKTRRLIWMKLIMKNGCTCQAQPKGTIYK